MPLAAKAAMTGGRLMRQLPHVQILDVEKIRPQAGELRRDFAAAAFRADDIAYQREMAARAQLSTPF